MTKKAENEYYLQCKMRLHDTIEIAWIPMSYAKKGKFVQLKKQGTWENGWCIEEVGSMPLPGDVLYVMERDFTKTREASDI